MDMSIRLRGDGSELVPYNFGEYPVYARHGRMGQYHNMKVACHWHDDWEFIYMDAGSMGYFVNGVTLALRQGEGVFVNSRCIHYNFALDGADAQYTCVLIHPSLLQQNEIVRRRYVEPILNNPGMGYRVLDREGAAEIFDVMDAFCRVGETHPATEGLTLMHGAYRILEALYADMAALPADLADTDPRLAVLHRMIGYVQANYAGEVTLADIASAGHISKSSCCGIFRQYLKQTPINYLTHYRMERAGELLAGTNLSVTEIALRTGFASQSYFTEIFRRHCGMTPSEYRRTRLQDRA